MHWFSVEFLMHFWLHFEWILGTFWVNSGMIFCLSFSSYFRCVFVSILGSRWASETLILQYLPCENVVFKVRPSRKMEGKFDEYITKIGPKMETKSMKKPLKNQSKNDADFGAKNDFKMGPKMSPGTPQGATKNETKNEAKNHWKKGLRVYASHARFLPSGGGAR